MGWLVLAAVVVGVLLAAFGVIWLLGARADRVGSVERRRQRVRVLRALT
jgi:hypothetical protein